ncbi:carbamoyl-phosphate synthase large subunit [Desulfonispora thiosulfatigenes DSM 11270]|uniref:Carbamoyl phosphate synthase large chain n=1 Tax=Desulfonispora thiosulfatigenes DSM 11270 TaxID=656914 RepID=A0A1W1US61_DESTI|nr:carbamoyl-phosphate synthase large subunit [Desulfonispora thiosulfatigenes]SMB83574.1 carbamoyl-phosphate synthase large subunit [Desulfonispora thiosulfatigenes DSM 11270]
MPKRKDLKKIMVIGSGPIIIGQAAEFDYAGTQACKSLKEEGIEVVLVNSNPATIMTDENIANKVYIEPLNLETLTKIIEKERPDGIIPGLGGQTGLNLACELSDAKVLEKYKVELLGTSLTAIKKSEDREEFKDTMILLNEPIPKSVIITKVEEAKVFAKEVGFPVIIRPAYTLGGTGGGLARNEQELEAIVSLGLHASRIGQVLLEQGILGWKEIEIEIMRDRKNNCIIICSMENFDPMGIHTGDSIVFAPTQTLTNKQFQIIRKAAIKIIRSLEIEGGCNIQFGFDPKSNNYVVIEVNPRLSRSSALASKATGYPIAKIATKIAIGYSLDELKNPITGTTSACFEPSIDYVVTKIPRWPFDKFPTANRLLGTQMKATGEVMAIERTIEASLLKAVRSLETGENGLLLKNSGSLSDVELENRLKYADDERLFIIAEAFRRNWPIKEVGLLTLIDKFFLAKIKNIIDMEFSIKNESLKQELLIKAKRMGFSDAYIANLKGIDIDEVTKLRMENNPKPVYKSVDTCAGEFTARTPYYYSCYEQENELKKSNKDKVIVLGSGPIRIGQGIEFDYCSVHAVWALREAGFEAIIINNNPETVSTDFDTSDRLYFDPLDLEDVVNIINEEKPKGVIVQFGGQTAINLAEKLSAKGINIFGTTVENIDIAEDRKKFERFLKELEIPQTKGKTATKVNEVENIANELGFPLLVRPSYVLGGRAMKVVYNMEELIQYVESAVDISFNKPILIDKYIEGKEIEVDAICDGETVIIPGIMEHIERAGVHSGDSMAVYPTQDVSKNIKDKVIKYTKMIGKGLKIKGIYNIQFVIANEQAYVIEVNPRASRTVPILSKVTGLPLIKLATWAMLGRKFKSLGYSEGLWPEPNYVVVKSPVFSFEKLSQVETSLGPEMKSTGEVLGIDDNFGCALYKAITASGKRLPGSGSVLVSVAKRDLEEALPIVLGLESKGFQILATNNTAKFLNEHGVNGILVENPLESIKEGKVHLVINTPSKGKSQKTLGFKMRRLAADNFIPCFTSLDTAQAFLETTDINFKDLKYQPIKEYLSNNKEGWNYCSNMV